MREKDGDKDKSPIEGIIKKIVSVGVGAAFMTEESIKKALEDMPLPKDIIQGLIANAKSAKDDVAKGIREEIGHYLSKVDTSKVVSELLEKYDLEIHAQIKFQKKKKNTDND